MLAILALLSQLAATQPLVIPPGVDGDEKLVATVVTLDDEREMTVLRNGAGKAVRLIVRRTDGKPMTCDPYFAWVSHEFSCGQGCYQPYTANGHAGGTSYSNAGLNARNDGCSQTNCSPGNYEYCDFIEAVAGVYYDAGGTCGYTNLHEIFVVDNCAEDP